MTATQTSPTLERVLADLKEAMRAKDALRLKVLRAIKGGADDRGKAAVAVDEASGKPRKGPDGKPIPAPRPANEADAIAAIRDEIKKANETAEGFRQAKRDDRVAELEAEIAVLAEYLPKAPGKEALEAAIDAIVSGLEGEVSMKRMGDVLAKLAERFGAALDRGAASPLVKARLTR